MDIEQINTARGRFYRTPEGNLYPSVTTIVGALSKRHITEWRKTVGDAEADRISRLASSHGTRFHDLMERTLKEGEQILETMNEFRVVYGKILTRAFPHISNIRCVEERLYSDILQCAGTVDLVCEWDGKKAICDWKTTAHPKYPQDVIGYWLQTAAYAQMMQERFGYIPEQLVLLFNESDFEFYFYKQPVAPWLKKFKELREAYRRRYGR